jgi:general secretion pathway protein K
VKRIARTRKRERGFALLIVLWTLALLTLLATQVVTIGRSETRLAGNLRRAAILEARADGAVHEALFHLVAGQWDADGLPHSMRIGNGIAEVRMEDDDGKINPNYASPALLAALLRNVGVGPATSLAIGTAINSWRFSGTPDIGPYVAAGLDYGPPGMPFQTLDELGLVLGVTPAMKAALMPYLSIYKMADIDRTLAPSAVAAALAVSPEGRQPAPPRGVLPAYRVVSILATASGPDGARATRQAVVRLPNDPAEAAKAPYQIVAWSDPGE